MHSSNDKAIDTKIASSIEQCKNITNLEAQNFKVFTMGPTYLGSIYITIHKIETTRDPIKQYTRWES